MMSIMIVSRIMMLLIAGEFPAVHMFEEKPRMATYT
jgi:hypothetical protein